MKLCEISYVGSSKVDREAGVIRGVKVLGRESKNGRTYSDRALQEAAKLYAGIEVNVNHPDRSRPTAERRIEDGFGWLEAVEVKADGVYADLCYLKEHPVAGLVSEAAERNPKRFGLSHNAEGKTERQNGKTVVESVERVLSVDLVQNPATNSGLFESEYRPVREVLEQHAPRLYSLLEDAALLPPEDVTMPQGETGPDPDEQVKAAIVQLLTAALDSEGDARAIVSQIMDTAQALLAGLPDPEPAEDPMAQPDAENPAETADPSEEEDPTQQNSPADGSANPFDQKRKKGPPMAESTKPAVTDPAVKALIESHTAELNAIKAELAASKTREAGILLLESSNREVTELRLKALASVADDATRKELVESWPERAKVSDKPRPSFSAPLRESVDAAPYSKDRLVAALK